MAELTHPPADRELSSGVLVTGDGGAPAGDPSDDRLMTLAEHLGELRRRLIIGILAIGAGTVIGFFLAPEAIRILAEPIPGPLVFTQPAGAFMLFVTVALMIGVAFAFPVLLYQLWAFISPGLTARERAVARPWIPLALLFLVLGIVLAYLVLPVAVTFLLGFGIEGVIQPLITTDAYMGFVTMMFIAFGLVMQFPILLMLLARAGVVSAARLRRSRRYMLLAIVIVAVVVTPADPISTVIMTAVMYPLYELSIFLAGRSERRRLADG